MWISRDYIVCKSYFNIAEQKSERVNDNFFPLRNLVAWECVGIKVHVYCQGSFKVVGTWRMVK